VQWLTNRKDTWDPKVLGGGISHYAGVNHGTFLHIAHEEGLIRNTSIHAGIRAPVLRPKGDLRNDLRCGFDIVKARDIDRIGISGVIERLKDRVGDSRVYISVDIDVLDPAFAPGKWFAYTLTSKKVCCRTQDLYSYTTRCADALCQQQLVLPKSEVGRRASCSRSSMASLG
jgi:hypothetical protein